MIYRRLPKKVPSDMHLIAVKYGLWMLAGFVGFFLGMFLIGFGGHSELRLFNGIIQIFCLYRAIRAYYGIHPENLSNYLYGVAQGMRASAIGVGSFTVFLTIFLALNPVFMNEIRQNSLMGEYLNPFTANLVVLSEGLTVGLIVSYLLTRILEITIKKD